MYVFEFTDNEIKIFNKKTKKLVIEKIPKDIIKNNKIYDFLKLTDKLNKIVYNYKIINTFFRIKIIILVFESITPTEEYLFKSLFVSFSNADVQLININNIFDNRHLFISGDNLYYNNKKIERISKGEYILIGNYDKYSSLKKKIEKNNITLLEYENSNTIIYEKV